MRDAQAAILVLGGTRNALEIAEDLALFAAFKVTYSLAGVTRNPVRPKGADVRIGGFGGTAGLAAWLKHEKISAVVLATHPFATEIAKHATSACLEVGVLMFVLKGPKWPSEIFSSQEGDFLKPDVEIADNLDDLAEAIQRRRPDTVFLALGRQVASRLPSLATTRRCVIRIAEPLKATEALEDVFPKLAKTSSCQIIAKRGPFTLEEETVLFEREGVDLLVCKDSGLSFTFARMEAARRCEIPVLMLARPACPDIWETSRDIHLHVSREDLITDLTGHLSSHL